MSNNNENQIIQNELMSDKLKYDVSVERCFLNPCCASWRMLRASRCCMILLVIMCSSILQVMDASDIGR